MAPGERLLPLRLMVYALSTVLALSVATCAWWWWFDPILPRIDVEFSEIRLYPPLPGSQPGTPRIYGVRRQIFVHGAFAGTINPSFQRSNDAHVETMDGRPVMQDGTTYSLPPVRTSWTAGRHIRERLWELPANVQPGAWQYIVHLEACNPLRCAQFHFDPLPIRVD